MDNFILSIAIPTYNRSKSLDFLLQSICQQISNEDHHKLEVLIFDNCSEDDTEGVATKFASIYPYIRYIRHKTNKGADNNFVTAFERAQGQYLWMIGDDELLFTGAIQWVIHQCEHRAFGCAYLYSIPESLEQIHKFLNKPIPENIKIRTFTPWPFAQTVNYRLTFLSGSIINRRAVLTSNPMIANDIQQFVGSNLVHLTWIFTAILSMPYSLLITTPLFASTIANSSGYNPVTIFIVNLSRFFDFYFSKTQPTAQSFIKWFTLIGWFPRVTYEMRFSDKYKNTGFKVSASNFPKDMQRGISWTLFNKGVLQGSKLIAFTCMVLLKLSHKMIQAALIRRSI